MSNARMTGAGLAARRYDGWAGVDFFFIGGGMKYIEQLADASKLEDEFLQRVAELLARSQSVDGILRSLKLTRDTAYSTGYKHGGKDALSGDYVPLPKSTGDIIHDIQAAQVEAGEQAVMANLKRMGL